MALIFRFNTRYKEPDTYDDAKEQSLHQKPYKPVYATEAYMEMIEDCVHYVANPTRLPKPKNSDVLHRVTEVYNGLLAAASHPDEDVDFSRGQSNWFVDQVKELMNNMVFYSVNVTSSFCSVTGDGIYQEDTPCTLVATPSAHASITSNPWTGLPASAVISADFLTVSFIVDQDYNITCSAVEDPKYTLTFEVSDPAQGSIDVTTFTDYVGEKVTVTATPVRATEKYHFLNWRQGTTVITTENPHEFVVGSSDETFTVYFEEDVKYTWSFYGINGTVTTDQFTGYVGDQVLVDFEPAEHHHFQDWNDGSTECPRLFTLTATTASYTANGVEDQKYTLTFLSEAEGTVSPTTFTGYPNDTVTVTATPDAAHDFKQWSDGNTDNPRLFTVGTEDQTFTASYEAHKFTLTFAPSVAGAGTCSPSTFTGKHGATVRVTAAASSLYKLNHWSDFDSVHLESTTGSISVDCSRTPSGDLIKDSSIMYCWGAYYAPVNPPTTSTHWWEYDTSTTTWTDVTASNGLQMITNAYTSDNPREFTVGLSNEDYTYAFEALPTVTYTFTGVNGTCDPATYTGLEGSTVSVEFKPAAHYHFSQWDDGDTNNPRTFTLGSTAKAYSATGIEEGKYRLSFEPLVAGSGTFQDSSGTTITYFEGYEGDTVAVTAVPTRTTTEKYHFTKWNDGDTSNPRTFTVSTSAVTYTGTFTEDSKYTLTFNAGDNGNVKIDSTTAKSLTFSGYEGDTVSVTAVPDTDCRFKQWSDGSSEITRTFTVKTSAQSFTAQFECQYTITFALATAGSGTFQDSSGSTITEFKGYSGDSVVVTAVPTRTSTLKYSWSTWDDGVTTNPRTFTIDTSTVTYTGTFVEDPKYKLTVTANLNGLVKKTGTTTEASVIYFEGYEGDTFSVTAVPNSGYELDQWSTGDTDNPHVFTVGTVAASYSCTFKVQTKYTLYFTADNGTCSPTSYTGLPGDTVKVTVTPIDHYHFVTWSDWTAVNPRIFDVGTESKTYNATCSEDPKYTITFQAATGGELINTATGTVISSFTGYVDDTVEVRADADDNHTFTKWNDDNTDNPRTFTVTAVSSITYTPTFIEKQKYHVYFLTSGGGEVSEETLFGFTGESYTVWAIPNSGYRFTSWGDGDTEIVKTITIGTSDQTIDVNFEALDAYIVLENSSGNVSFTLGNRTSLEGSEDNVTWATLTGTSITSSTSKYYLRGTKGSSSVFKFTGGNFTKVYGKLGAIINYADPDNVSVYGQFANMFTDQTTLVDASGLQLPSGITVSTKYTSAFQNCTALKMGPSRLPGDIVTTGTNTYYQMFYGCTSLVASPILESTTTCAKCYYEMFRGCSSLRRITCYTETVNNSDSSVTNWAAYVSEGSASNPCTFVGHGRAGWNSGSSGIPSTWLCDFDDCFTFGGTDYDTSKITVTMPVNTGMKASTTGGAFSSFSAGYTFTAGTANRVYFFGTSASLQFQCVTGTFTKVIGNVMHLVSADGEATPTSSQFYYSSKGLFTAATTLVDASGMTFPSTTAANCFNSMFSSCFNLKYPPKSLPAATLTTNCYKQMFSGCSSLLSSPKLNKITTMAYGGCQEMFYSCQALTSASSFGSALSTITEYCCFAMYRNCIALTSAPAWVNVQTIEANGCNLMYAGCVSLTTAPSNMSSVTSITTKSLSNMFNGCTALSGSIYVPYVAASSTTTNGMFTDAGTGHSGSISNAIWVPTDSRSTWESDAGISTDNWFIVDYT